MSTTPELRRRSLLAGATALAAAPAIIGSRAQAAPAQHDLTVAVPDNLVTLDPADANDTLSQGACRLMLEGLYGFDKDMKIIPVLATGYKANATATEFTFTLHEGVKFHDGTPFNAEAVKINLERIANPANHLKRLSLLSMLDHVEVVNEHTAKVVLKTPFGAFIPTVAHPALALSSPAAIAKYGKDLGRNPVGTGPFIFTNWTPDTLKVHANPHYRLHGLPHMRTVTIRSVPENGARLAMLQTGEAQYIFPMPPELVATIKNNPKIELVNAQSIIIHGAAMNTMKKPFDDIRVRQALNYAVDKDAFIKVVYNGYADQMDSPEPPKLTYYKKQGVWPYDLAKAKKLLADAGYPNGFETEMWGANNTLVIRGMQFLQQQFANVGVKLKVSPLEVGLLIANIYSVPDPQKATVQMNYGGWSSSTGDADWGLRPLFTKEAFPPKMFNVAYLDDPAVNKDIADGLNTAEPKLRAAAYADAQKRIWEDCPWVWLDIDRILDARATNLQGAYRLPDGGLLINDAHFV